MANRNNKTLRLIFPQWQGGNNPPYYLGAKLLSWLAPQSAGPVEEVPVIPPSEIPPREENGIVGRSVLTEQLSIARQLIEQHSPDSVVVLGGRLSCLSCAIFLAE
ncbi:hypothetical protein [Xenorhabdus sp. NBAII XenSa04]|uniref:hypothetical protein n=1 Tax=Xenorhabdus TaxID=626 RepID=UPI000B024428